MPTELHVFSSVVLLPPPTLPRPPREDARPAPRQHCACHHVQRHHVQRSAADPGRGWCRGQNVYLVRLVQGSQQRETHPARQQVRRVWLPCLPGCSACLRPCLAHDMPHDCVSSCRTCRAATCIVRPRAPCGHVHRAATCTVPAVRAPHARHRAPPPSLSLSAP